MVSTADKVIALRPGQVPFEVDIKAAGKTMLMLMLAKEQGDTTPRGGLMQGTSLVRRLHGNVSIIR